MSAEALLNLPLPSKSRNNITRLDEQEPYGLFHDIRKSVDLYYKLVAEKGVTQAAKIFIGVIQEDLYSIGWETIDTNKPYEFGYQLINTPNGINMVHDSDQYNGKDILLGIDKRIRRKTEYLQWENLKNRLIQAEEDTTFFTVSPKLDREVETRQDCYYPDTFLTALYKGANGKILARQLKSTKVGTQGAADLQNALSDLPVINRNAPLDQIITSVGERKGYISDAVLNSKLEEISGELGVDKADIEQMKKEAGIGAWKIYWAVRSGMNPAGLNDLYSSIILRMVKDQPGSRVSYDTEGRVMIHASCSFIRGGNTSNSLKELLSGNSESSGGIKCPHCEFVNHPSCVKDDNCNGCGKELKESSQK